MVLPASMGRLTGLQKLNLSRCKGLTTLPESMSRLTGMQELDLSRKVVFVKVLGE